MEHASQTSMESNRKGTKPEESLPSCSGKISRTGEQYGFSWESLPEEIVVTVFNLLSNKDLLACRAVCKRFVRVIGESVLLDKAKSFWKQFSQPPDPTLFGRDRYQQVLHPWFEAFVTAQQRLADDSSDDLQHLQHLQLSDGKREETERQASPEQTGQEQPVKSSQVKQLDRLIEYVEFPKALFFIQAKTLQNAKSLYFQEKVSHSCPTVVKTVCFSPDGRNLLIPFGKTIRFMVLDGNGNVVRQYDKGYSSDVTELRFSPNSCSLLIRFCNNIAILGLDGEDWVQRGETECTEFFYFVIDDFFLDNDIKRSVDFSPDSDSLATVFNHSVRVMGRDETGNWVQNASIPFSDPFGVCFSLNGSLAILNENDVGIMGRDETGNWVKQNSEIPDKDNHFAVQSVCFSPDGGSCLISVSRGRYFSNFFKSVEIMVSDGKGNWVQNLVIPCEITGYLDFGPDGRILRLSTFYKSQIIRLDGANHTVCSYMHSSDAICFSPDGGGLAISCGSTTWAMGLDKGKWVEKACIPNEGEVRTVCFSPDGRRLAIILIFNGSECRRSQVKTYEIK